MINKPKSLGPIKHNPISFGLIAPPTSFKCVFRNESDDIEEHKEGDAQDLPTQKKDELRKG